MKSAARKGLWLGQGVYELACGSVQPSYGLSQSRAKFDHFLLDHTPVNWPHGKFLALNSTPLTLRISAFILDTESPSASNSAGVNLVP